jgi:DNA topoisomerase-1
MLGTACALSNKKWIYFKLNNIIIYSNQRKQMIYTRIKDGVGKDTKPKFKIIDSTGATVNKNDVLDYVTKLVIPPAYDDVKIFYEKNPKILFQGYDAKGRLQQIYSHTHKKKAMKKKFCALLHFGKVLPKIEADIKNHMSSTTFTKNKIISLIIKIVIICGFRIGNIKYQKLYNSFGISNIFKEHISMEGPNMLIKFIGKKGVLNECIIKDKTLIGEIIKLISNKSKKDYVFTYKKNGTDEVIKAIEINKWLKEYHIDTTSKHFRTYDTNLLFIAFMRDKEDPVKASPSKRKKIVVDAMKIISCQINNTPAICKKEYLHIDLLNLYLENPKKFKKYFFGCSTPRQCFINYLEEFCK